MSDIKKYLNSFIDEIKLLIDNKTKKLDFDKTYRGIVKNINNEICEVEINGQIFECKIRNDLQINVDDVVLIKIINNNFSDKYVDAKLGVVGDGVSEGVDWANVLNKPTDFPPSHHTQDVFTIEGLSNVAISGSYNDLIDKPLEKTTYIHAQNTPLSEWLINHNLQRYPSINVVDSGGSVVLGDIQYIDENNILLKFNGGFSGKAYLN
ncbi:MAG TPA: hypothetical protein GX708_02975 [Gallicola sp.]|nr:hypothetical protein [Gallicola sp.]